MVTHLTCVNCGSRHGPEAGMTCPTCGPDDGILDVAYDVPTARASLRPSLPDRPHHLWRYLELLPVDHFDHSLHHIGWTPLIDAPRLAGQLGIGRIRLKDDGRSASCSFKDRASAIGVAHAMEHGYKAIACSSTGNAATSLAYCSACVGISAHIFVPRQVPQGKLAQLLAFGANVYRVMGSYAEAYALCSDACRHLGWYNRNCAVNPYLVEGKKTGGLEIAEQCAEDPPDWVVVSVGDGCSIAGIHKGIRQMRETGVIDWSTRMLGVQSEGAAPIVDACETGNFQVSRGPGTYADSINVAHPRNWRKAIMAVRESDGRFVTVTDDEIKQSVGQCGRHAGVFPEPAAAAAIGGTARARASGVIGPGDSVVACITGNGLKDVDGALAALDKPYDIRPDLSEVERILNQEQSSENKP
jgi:threonine synthase